MSKRRRRIETVEGISRDTRFTITLARVRAHRWLWSVSGQARTRYGPLSVMPDGSTVRSYITCGFGAGGFGIWNGPTTKREAIDAAVKFVDLYVSPEQHRGPLFTTTTDLLSTVRLDSDDGAMIR